MTSSRLRSAVSAVSVPLRLRPLGLALALALQVGAGVGCGHGQAAPAAAPPPVPPTISVHESATRGWYIRAAGPDVGLLRPAALARAEELARGAGADRVVILSEDAGNRLDAPGSGLDVVGAALSPQPALGLTVRALLPEDAPPPAGTYVELRPVAPR